MAASRCVGLFAAAIAGSARRAARACGAGVHGAGLQRRGSQPQGMHGAGACTAQGLQPQGVRRRVCQPQGVSAAGHHGRRGFTRRGCQPQGLQRAGRVAAWAPISLGADFKGVEIGVRRDARADRRQRASQAYELTSVPTISTGPGQLHLGRRRIRPSVTTRSRTCVDAHGQPGRGPRPLHRRRAKRSDAEPVPSRRRAGQRGRALRRVLLPQVERPVDVALPVRRRHRSASAMAIAEDPAAIRTSSSSPARRPASPSKCARNWGFRPWAQRRSLRLRRRRPATGSNGRFALKPYYDVCKIAARAAYCQDRPELHARTARWSICSTPARSSGRTRSRTRSSDDPTTRAG